MPFLPPQSAFFVRKITVGFKWHLGTYVESCGIGWDELSNRLGFTVARDLRGTTPPLDLSLPVLADLCQALICQPGDLLTFEPDSVAEQAERQLAENQLYQSFLAFKAGPASEEQHGD
jgi:DNA-binding Xre family transcriptional regulator